MAILSAHRALRPLSRRALLAACLAAIILAGCQAATARPGAAVPTPGPAVLALSAQDAAEGKWFLPTPEPARPLVGPPRAEHLAGVQVRLYAGTGQRGAIDGPAREAQFDGPFALVRDSMGNLIVAEKSSGRMRVVGADGLVRTWVGTPNTDVDASSESPFSLPTGLAIDAQDNLYVVDGMHRLVMVRRDGSFELLAGGTLGFQDGPALSAAFYLPSDVALNGETLYISDALNRRIRLLAGDGHVYTLAGSGEPGYADGAAPQARFGHPNGLALAPDGSLLVADGGSLNPYDAANTTIRRVAPDGQVSTYAGMNAPGYVDGPARDARFQQPLLGLAMDARGNLYVADMNNHVVRVVTADGRVLTVAGDGTYGLREGAGAQAQLGLPTDVWHDGQGGLYVADFGQQVIWFVDLSQSELGS